MNRISKRAKRRQARTSYRQHGRLGTATIELALCLPLMVLVTFGAVEGANMIFLKQSLTQSSYEGIKVAIKPNATNAEVVAATASVLGSRIVNSVTVTLDPSDIESVDRGELIRITVTAPSDSNSIFPIGPFVGRNVSGVAVMVKE